MTHPDLDELLNALVPRAKQMLAEAGEFHPFGSEMLRDGEIVAHPPYEGDEPPPAPTLIDTMTVAFRQDAFSGKIRAAGICFDVRVVPPGETEKTDAICASVEHQTGQAMDVFLPYTKGWLGKIQYGELFAARRTPQFFLQTEGDA